MSWRRERPNEAQWRRFRLTVLDRDNWQCVKCGRKGRLEVDHINGHAAGVFDPANCQTLCRTCHLAKSRAESIVHTPERDAWRAYMVDILECDKM